MNKKIKARTGCDIVYIPRFKRMLERTPSLKDRCFTPAEVEGASIQSLAGKYAAKEAVVKTLGLQLSDLNQIEIIKDESGKPHLAGSIHDLADLKIESHDISISHDGDYALAVVVMIVDR